jgi:hypothetical protein
VKTKCPKCSEKIKVADWGKDEGITCPVCGLDFLYHAPFYSEELPGPLETRYAQEMRSVPWLELFCVLMLLNAAITLIGGLIAIWGIGKVGDPRAGTFVICGVLEFGFIAVCWTIRSVRPKK